MLNYKDHSKFLYINYDQIQEAINSGEIDAWDLVLCQDTKEFVLVTEDLSLVSIKSKIYRFLDVKSAEEALNKFADTYAGQIVAILNSRNGNYDAYIVNQRSDGSYKVDPLNIYSGSVDYDTLGHRPITNLYSDAFSPAVLDQQAEGVYTVQGAYKVSDSIETIYDSCESYIFLVHHEGDTTYIKRIGASEITDYTIHADGTHTSAVVPTTQWLQEQGYITEKAVDAKIAALDFIRKEDIEEYVSNVVLQTVNGIVDERITVILDEKLQPTTPTEITDLFKRRT